MSYDCRTSGLPERTAVAFRLCRLVEPATHPKSGAYPAVCGIGAVRFRSGRPSHQPEDRFERWFYPYRPTYCNARVLDPATPAQALCGRDPAQLYMSDVTCYRAFDDFNMFVGNSRTILWTEDYAVWNAAVKLLPVDCVKMLRNIRSASLRAFFARLGKHLKPDEPIQRRKSAQDELYGYARQVGLETPLKLVEKRRTLADEAELAGLIWFRANALEDELMVRAGLKPAPEWLALYRKIDVRDLGLNLKTRIVLRTSYKDRKAVKALGARWDADRHCWFISVWQDPVAFRAWLSEEDFERLTEMAARRFAASTTP